MTESAAEEKQMQETDRQSQVFVDHLDVDIDLARTLVSEGFTSLEEVAYVPVEEMMGIEGFDEEVVNELRQRAKDRLLTQALAREERLDGAQPAADLLGLEGLEENLAYELAAKGVKTLEDLAEQATDDLEDIEGLDSEKAAELIMKARNICWFGEQN